MLVKRRRESGHEFDSGERIQEKYLNTLCGQLWGLPGSRQREIQRELASHIELAVLEQQCDGVSQLVATHFALQQLGRPAKVGRLLAWQWHQENTMKNPRLIGLLGLGAVLLSGLWLLGLFSTMSHLLSPSHKVLILGAEGARMSVQNGSLQVASGEAAVIGFSPLGVAVAFGVPFLLVLSVAVAGCIAMVRRQNASTR
jgi:hypothetical protein